MGEHPVAEPPVRLLQRPVRVRTHHAVHVEAALLLERADRGVGAVVEDRRLGEARTGTVAEQAEPGQAGADVGHGITRVAQGVGPGRRAGGADIGTGDVGHATSWGAGPAYSNRRSRSGQGCRLARNSSTVEFNAR